jgi:BirA family transcriptional regulator, biotin operon repressor / biotin---[acetyl-CoA-carboxylase] ligase
LSITTKSSRINSSRVANCKIKPGLKGHAALLTLISDGQLHSGQDLATQLNISRAAIWKSIKHLESLGLQIEAVRGRGYRLTNQIEMISERVIKKSLSPIAMKCCKEIDVLFKTESTNSFLFNRLGSEQIHGHAVLAEYQSNGRGRRGNQWVSPLASGVCVSVAWHFDIAPSALGLLSLYMGVATARTLCALGITDVGLKWPNDVVIKDKKLGGILLELRGEASGPVDVIIGIGVNYDLPESAVSDIDQAVTDICRLAQERLSRNTIAATLISNVFEILHGLQSDTGTSFIEEWRQHDRYVGRKARLILPDKEIEGILKGVDNQGSLLMTVDGQLKSYTSGEVSLRIQQ